MGVDLEDQFVKTIEFFGTDGFDVWCRSKDIFLPPRLTELMSLHKDRMPVYESLVSYANNRLYSKDAISLLSQMLRMCPVS